MEELRQESEEGRNESVADKKDLVFFDLLASIASSLCAVNEQLDHIHARVDGIEDTLDRNC